jgi:ribosomal protein L16/L10AE
VKSAHDPEKWKKKFILVFNREKIIDFSGGNNIFPFEVKHLTVKPKAINKIGEKMLKHNAKFWIIYVRMIPERIVDAHKEELRNELIQLFKDS